MAAAKKPTVCVLTLTDEGNGEFEVYAYLRAESAKAFFVKQAKAKGKRFQPEAEDPYGGDSPRRDPAAIAEWLVAQGCWYYDEAICWRLEEVTLDDGKVALLA